MITGYNTDVRHHEFVFHVQTEDKGLDNPFIESLVYVGGQVLAAKRAGYADLLSGGEGDRAILDLMDRQHRTVIAAIKQGKFDSKLEALLGARRPPTDNEATGAHEKIDLTAPQPIPAAAQPAPAPSPVSQTGSRPAHSERSLDQVILEYLTSEADQEQLLLTVDGDRNLALGNAAELAFRTTSSKTGRPVPGSRIQVRMISTVADPRVLAQGDTDPDGSLVLAFSVPSIDRGTAALIITASGAVGRAELKHLL